jgi:hypothetical protein
MRFVKALLLPMRCHNMGVQERKVLAPIHGAAFEPALIWRPLEAQECAGYRTLRAQSKQSVASQSSAITYYIFLHQVFLYGMILLE